MGDYFSGRDGHQAVAFDGSLWVLGGRGDSGGLNDVWRSADGKSWEEVTIEGDSWAVRKSHQVVSFGGEMWLMGGKVDDGSANKQGRAHGDVWASSNGVNWRRVVESAPWAARQTHQVVSYHGSLWLMGGYNRQGFRNTEGELEGQSYGDIWRSADGENWVSVAVSSPSPFRERRIHQMVVTREPLPFVYQQLAVAVTGPSGALTVTVDGGATAPVTVASLMASGGSGDLRFEMAADAAGDAGDGVDCGAGFDAAEPDDGGGDAVFCCFVHRVCSGGGFAVARGGGGCDDAGDDGIWRLAGEFGANG